MNRTQADAGPRPAGDPQRFCSPRPLTGLLLVAVALLASPATTQDSETCMGCHGMDFTVERDGREFSIFVDLEQLEASAHAAVDCIDCHVDLAGVEGEHEPGLEPARCDSCHDDSFDSIAAYLQSAHGQAVASGDTDAARCADCHGGHRILSSVLPESRTHPLQVDATCTACHTADREAARPAPGETPAPDERRRDRIHAELGGQGLMVAPNCATCHAAHGALPHDDPESRIHRSRVNETCTQCHADPGLVHEATMPVEVWAEGDSAPLCVDCHAPHAPRTAFYDTNMADQQCLACHGEAAIAAGDGRPELFVDPERNGHSVHGRHDVSCAQCHTDVRPSADERACRTSTGTVDCASCHAGRVDEYDSGVHGRLHAEGDTVAPDCVDCHGAHDIYESRIPRDEPVPDWLRDRIRSAPTSRRNVPDLCGRCHSAGHEAAKRLGNEDRNIVHEYRDSVHGRGLLESGLVTSATCTDCHTAHRVLPADDPDSSIAPENIVGTCGNCHDGIEEAYQFSIHSAEANPHYTPAEGEPRLPRCNDCHTSHSVTRTDLPDFKREVMEQCGTCHEDVAESYFTSYHGKVVSLGSNVAAKCADCHGSHDVRPPHDPVSSLHEDNIVGTCAQCHEGAHQAFTGYIAHASHHDREGQPMLYWAFHLMTWLLVGVFGFFGLHVIAWLPRSLALRREIKAAHAAYAEQNGGSERREYQRFTPLQSTLHRTVIVSFLGLAITGMTLKFAQADWAATVMGLLGGPTVAGWIHRICAVITFGYMAVHLFDVVRNWRRSGKPVASFLFGPDSMMPRWKDVQDLAGTMRWFVGLGPRPRYGRWTYWEKFDYFAVFWGVIVIGVSGLMLWFPVTATKIVPGWALNVATIIHSEEALLATGFIFTIHFFNTHLRPEKFPMDSVVFTGRMSVSELKFDKPELYERLVQTGQLERHLVPAPTPVEKRRALTFGTIALLIGIAVLVLLVIGLLTVGL